MATGATPRCRCGSRGVLGATLAGVDRADAGFLQHAQGPAPGSGQPGYEAMYEVGLMLERGLGCLQNYSEAAFWYEEGAKRGHLESFNNLGVLYKDGHGVEMNETRSFICFKKAADGGLAEGLYNLGMLYDQGIGCEQNHDTALDYCRKAAYNGHEKAKEIIKGLQEEGKIVF